MVTRRELIMALGLGSAVVASGLLDERTLALAADGANAGAGISASGGEKVTKLCEQPLPGLKGKVGVVVLVDVPPGFTEKAHRHPGPVFVYMLEGSASVSVEPHPPKIYSKGEMWYEPPMHTHQSSTVGQSGPAKMLAFLILDKGAPLLIPVT